MQSPPAIFRLREILALGLPVVLALAILLAFAHTRPSQSVVSSDASTAASHLQSANTEATALLSDIRIRTVTQTDVPILNSPSTVVMLVSSTCGHCHLMLSRLAESAQGDSLAFLRVVVLEGTETGQQLLARLGVRAEVAGPTGDPQALLRDLRALGTPMWWALDARGAVVAQRIGELDASETPRWSQWTRTGVKL